MAGRLTGDGTAARRRRRALAVAGLVAGVTVVHLMLGERLLQDQVGAGAAAGPRPIEVAYVRELALQPPAPAAKAAQAKAPPPTRAPARRAAPKPAPMASAPADEPAIAAAEPWPVAEPASAPLPAPEPATASVPPVLPAALEPAPEPEQVAAAASAASAAGLPPAPASALAFDWPPSTRLSYRLQGYYRGDAQGSAVVEWRRTGTRYQVQLEARVGPAFAPLMVRRIVSDGEITDAGLAPRRFDGEQRVAFSTRRWSLRFEPARILLADGREAPPAEGVQDEASQFVQLTWLFTSQPHLLKPGQSVTLPLVLRRRVDRWIYDVVGEELLELPFGPVPTVHLKPRRSAVAGGDMVAQIWVAPGLQYLPVRILIHQDPQTFVDLMLEAPPLQAVPEAPGR